MSFIQNASVGFAVIGIFLHYTQGRTDGILLCGFILVSLFLSYILQEIKKSK